MNTSEFKVASIIRRAARIGRSAKECLAEYAGISYPTQISIIKSLKIQGALLPDETNVNPRHGYLIGFAFGYSHIKVTVIDYSYNITTNPRITAALKSIARKSTDYIEGQGVCLDMPEEQNADDNAEHHEFVKMVNDILDVFIRTNPIEIIGIGFAFPGVVDDKAKKVLSSPNKKWFNDITPQNLIMPKIFSEITTRGIAISFQHNSKASAIAEKEVSLNSFNEENLISLYVGTGIGAGYIFNNQLFQSKNNASGEIGHISLPSPIYLENDDNRLTLDTFHRCSCGKKGCIEQLVREHVFNCNDLKDYNHEVEKAIENCAVNYRLLSKYLAYLVAMLINSLNPDCIVINGRFAQVFDHIWVNLISDMKEYVFSGVASNCNIRTSSLGRFSPAVGAAICSNFEYESLPIEW